MAVREVIRHQVAIAGRVSEAQTGQALAGARVLLTDAPQPFVDRLVTRAKLLPPGGAPAAVRDARALLDDPAAGRAAKLLAAQTVLNERQADANRDRPDVARVAADGHYHFLDLPDGDYTLAASWPQAGSRYGSATAQATVARNAEGRIVLRSADLALPATSLRGSVSAQGGGAVTLAEVRVQGSGERTFSDGQGQYALAGLESGKRRILVSAPGFQPAGQDVTWTQPGTVQTVNFALQPAP